ncbi:MAG: transposase [gamma proteobacterium symbiont of Bathyaustriella thionipta]|nr:transposase [gamma proteobacterium symbiont of Bathyaustriella thionipta]MCU7951493.1 transposase [gamma proteobacterium symbiont of Bathyaustriella thionipta]MCU7952832.1 transposase [gamma proteobacterium symbiont of Bathyaustriella thionipta]MCU7958059.1 transposase [gamma proteobacterium symbiont of Bathyaustriella thionipta]MCU7966328.1 transposase [gamma proteobacterium symbiont of Bathyaustriella thionipta]
MCCLDSGVHYISPFSPVWDKSKRKDGTYSSSEFTFDLQANEYICPNNKRLHTTNHPTKEKALYYYSRLPECVDCPDKEKCCPKAPQRRIARSIYEEARDIARAIHKTPEYQHSKNDRKKVEMLFGHLKRMLIFDQLRLRGLTGASDEFLLVATIQNLRRMVKIVEQPPPLTG